MKLKWYEPDSGRCSGLFNHGVRSKQPHGIFGYGEGLAKFYARPTNKKKDTQTQYFNQAVAHIEREDKTPLLVERFGPSHKSIADRGGF